jgi:hypothetical protein
VSGNVKQFVDFSANTNNDTGENNATSIQPMLDGENVVGSVLTRPSESLRQRTEAIRDVMADTLYLRDADRNLVAFCLGGITWPGSTSNAQSGIPVLTNALWLVPLLTPGALQIGAPPVASAFGVLHLKRSSDSSNSISVTSRRRSYAAGDQINVTVTSGSVFSCALDVETGFRRTIKIVATGTTTLGAVITALNGLIPPAPDNTQLVTAALEGGASSGDFLLVPQARQLVTGNYDGEAHQIGVGTLSSFFSSNPTQALAEGDSLCIRYDMVTDPASTGGRRQSLPENSNTAVPAGSLFNSRVHPEFLANALPICKVLNNKLVFGTGIEVPEGAVNSPLGGSAQGIVYGGGPIWADGTTNPATSVEAQLDKIVSDLGTGAGTAKVHGSAVGPASDVPAGTLENQLSTLVTLINDTKNQAAIRLLDGLAAQLAPGDLGAAADPEMSYQTPGSSNTGTEWCYAAALGAGLPVKGASNNIIRISSGTIYQRVPSSPQASFISYPLPGTDQFTIPNGNGVNPRVDLIQIRLQWTGASPSSNVSATINLKSGTPANPPLYPAPDSGFVPICYIVTGATFAGAFAPIVDGDPGPLSAFISIHDQRMPLGVNAYLVRPNDFQYNDDAWDISGHAGDGSPNFKKFVTNKSATNAELTIPCPVFRGRLIGFALMSRNCNSATGTISIIQEGASFGLVNVTTTQENSTTPNFKRVGQETLELVGGIRSIVTPLNPGGGIPRKAYGPPLWCDGTFAANSSGDFGGMIFDFNGQFPGVRSVGYVHSTVFNGGTPTRIYAAIFYVAKGIT